MSRDSVPGEVTSVSYKAAVDGEIAYIQSYDRIPRGSGAAHVLEGGIRDSILVAWSRSGDGQGIERTLEVYGIPGRV